MLEAGMKAPDFTLPDKDGKPVSLSDYLGKRVVVYFYSRDNTPGCTRQACAFAGAYSEFEALGTVVIGISRDSAASHALRPGAPGHRGLRRLAGKKELRQGQHGRRPLHLHHRRGRHHPKGHAQGKARYECSGRSQVPQRIKKFPEHKLREFFTYRCY